MEKYLFDNGNIIVEIKSSGAFVETPEDGFFLEPDEFEIKKEKEGSYTLVIKDPETLFIYDKPIEWKGGVKME